ncbi:MAG TPA: ABC transporter substrate-binding protein, partial [Candidatus Binatus sp.]|nr:ABC transporter substrate-binding protein [Candidatus Binatus sp.]
DPEITYIQGNIRAVQSLVAGEIQFGIAGSAGAVSARAAGEDVIIVAVPMNRLDYTFVGRQPVNKPADLAGKKVGIGAVGGSDEVATRIALEKLGVNPSSVTMLTVGGSAERLAALRAGSVDAATVGGATFIGGGAGLYKLIDLTDLGVEFPFTAIFTTKRFAVANRDTVLGFIRGYMRGVRFFQENKEEAIGITARNLRSTNKELLERQWSYVKDHVFEKIPYASEKGFKLIFDMLSPRNPKVAALRTDDVFDGSYVKELVDKGFFK